MKQRMMVMVMRITKSRWIPLFAWGNKRIIVLFRSMKGPNRFGLRGGRAILLCLA